MTVKEFLDDLDSMMITIIQVTLKRHRLGTTTEVDDRIFRDGATYLGQLIAAVAFFDLNYSTAKVGSEEVEFIDHPIATWPVRVCRAVNQKMMLVGEKLTVSHRLQKKVNQSYPSLPTRSFVKTSQKNFSANMDALSRD
jgi:hypothetical protein